MSSKNHNCDWVNEQIDLYLDDELGELERTSVDRHVATCAACGEELALARSVLDELRALPELRCPDVVVERAADAVRADVPSWRDRVHEWFGGRVAVFMRPAMATMLFVVIAAGAFVLTQRDGTVNRPGAVEVDGVTQKQIDDARDQTLLAFAYFGKYTTRGNDILRKDVMGERVIPSMKRAMLEGGGKAFRKGLISPVVKPSSRPNQSS